MSATSEQPHSNARESDGAPVFSLILCSRSDAYQGNSLWRTQTALNYLGQTVAALGRQDQVECLVVDWGSQKKLSDVLRLSADAAQIVKFIYVPPDVAKAEQQDSPFPEVIALNAAARRSRGQYIGRIDQDTLVGPHFLHTLFWLHEKRRLLTPMERAMLLSNRKRITVRFTVHSPSLWAVTTFVRLFSRFLPLMDPLPPHLFYQSYVGIWMLHRDVWFECRGYDERFIYMDWQEVDMMLRLSKYTLVNLGELTDHDMYHLDHGPARVAWSSQRNRKSNPVRDPDNPPDAFAPNGPDWGLNAYDLPPMPALASQAAEQEIRAPHALRWPAFLALCVWAWSHVKIDRLIVWMRPPFRKVGVAIETVAGQPIARWPKLLLARWNMPAPAVKPERR